MLDQTVQNSIGRHLRKVLEEPKEAMPDRLRALVAALETSPPARRPASPETRPAGLAVSGR